MTSGTGAAPLILAVPSKGRLQENAAAFFARAGMTFRQERGVRDYHGVLAGVNGVEVAFMSAADIIAQLAQGTIHLGVTGEDLVRETILDPDSRVCLLAPLGFGHARAVVAVPQAWIDVRTMADLADVAAAFHARRSQRMRVATKYVHLTRMFFSMHGVVDYRIVESSGATEAAPGAGQAELIVDITSSGDTLRANALKVLDDGVILHSEANLVAALGAKWTAAQRESARLILARIAAEEEARNTREVRARPPALNETQTQEALETFAARLRGRGQNGLVVFSCPKDEAPRLAEWLIALGAPSATVGAHEYVFTAQNPLWEKFSRHIA